MILRLLRPARVFRRGGELFQIGCESFRFVVAIGAGVDVSAHAFVARGRFDGRHLLFGNAEQFTAAEVEVVDLDRADRRLTVAAVFGPQRATTARTMQTAAMASLT